MWATADSCTRTEPRRWEDLALMGLHIVLGYAPKEIQVRRTAGCRRRSGHRSRSPWSAHLHPVPDIEGLLADLDPSNLLHRALLGASRLITLGVDEARAASSPPLRPGPRACPVGRPGQGSRHHRSLLQRSEHGAESARCLGQLHMSPAYIGAITHHCPNDWRLPYRGRGPQRTVRALDTQGRGDQGAAVAAQHALQTRTKGHTRFLNSLRNSNRRIHRGSRTSSSTSGRTAIGPRRRSSSDAG